MHEAPGIENSEAVFSKKSALDKEVGFLQRIQGKARRAADAMVLLTALSLGAGVAQEARAEGPTNPTAGHESVDAKETETINESKLTESSTWSRAIVAEVRAELPKIQNADDAEWLVRNKFGAFVSEFYMPTKGQLSEVYGIKTRKCGEDDTRLLLQSAKEMGAILEQIHTKQDFPSFKHYHEQFQDVVQKLERDASLSGRMQKEALDRAIRNLQQR